MTKTRKFMPPLSVQQRRCQIIDLLASHLACMPHAFDVPPAGPESPLDPGHEPAPRNPRESSRIGLELSAN